MFSFKKVDENELLKELKEIQEEIEELTNMADNNKPPTIYDYSNAMMYGGLKLEDFISALLYGTSESNYIIDRYEDGAEIIRDLGIYFNNAYANINNSIALKTRLEKLMEREKKIKEELGIR